MNFNGSKYFGIEHSLFDILRLKSTRFLITDFKLIDADNSPQPL